MRYLSSDSNSTDALAALPASAFRASVYADWRDGTFCRLPRQCSMARLPEAAQALIVARASSRRPYAALYTVPDVFQLGASVYAPEAAQRMPAFTDWQAAMLDAVRRVRRWRYYAEAEAAPALPAQPLDGCTCRVCLTRQ